MKYLLLLFLFTGCQTAYFFSSGFTTLDGKEITVKTCTEDWIKFVNLEIQYFELIAEKSELYAQINQSFLTEALQDNRLLEQFNKSIKEHNKLSTEKSRLKSITNYKDSIPLITELIEKTKDLIRLEQKLLQSFVSAQGLSPGDAQFYRLSSEIERLSAQNSRLVAKSYRFYLALCNLLTQGYQFTESDKQKATKRSRLIKQFNELTEKSNKLSNSKNLSALKNQKATLEQKLNVIKAIQEIEQSVLKEAS